MHNLPKIETLVWALIASTILCLPQAALAQDFKSETAAGLGAMANDQFDEAEKHLKKALASTQYKGPKYGDYSTALTNLGNLNAKRKKTSEAENYYREAMGHYKKAFGENSLECANINHALGEMYRKMGKYDSAIGFYEKAEKTRSVAASTHTDYADTLAGLAECKAKTGDPEEAIDLMQKVIPIREKAYGGFNMKVLKSRFMLGQLYEKVGKRPMAIASYESIIKDTGTSMPRSAETLERLGKLYYLVGKNKKADTAYQQALALREANPGKNNEDLNNCLKLYAEFLRKQHNEAQASKLEARITGGAKKGTK